MQGFYHCNEFARVDLVSYVLRVLTPPFILGLQQGKLLGRQGTTVTEWELRLAGCSSRRLFCRVCLFLPRLLWWVGRVGLNCLSGKLMKL